MRDQRIHGDALADPAHLKQALLGLLVSDHTGLWSITELDRHLQPSSSTPPGAAPNPAATEDALEDLYAAGLVHRIGTYACATRAAHAGQQLAD